MLTKRIIPSLLLDQGKLIKTEKFSRPTYIGDPINAVKIFNEKSVDELFVLDISASRQGSRPNFSLLEQIASEAFVPVAYGGGIRTLDDAQTLLSIGIEKLVINSAAFTRIEFISELRDQFGAQCVVGSVDAKKRFFRGYTVHSHSRCSIAERDPVLWSEKLVQAGAGEILLQSVDRDGTMQGFDLSLLAAFHQRLSVPLVAAGGAGALETMLQAFASCNLSGIAVGARFVFHGPHRGVLIQYLEADELRRLQNGSR